MIKLKYGSLSQPISFKLINKKRIIKNSTDKQLTPKLIRGICTLIENEYKISIDITSIKPNILDNSYPDVITIPFTEDSYNIVGLTTVFSRATDERGNYIRYIRDELKSKVHPGDPNRYVPFCHNWICSGYIIMRNCKLMFKFNECIAPKGYAIAQIEDE